MFLIARGIDLEAVVPRFASKSIACCKKFPGRGAITGIATLNHWLKELSMEIRERLEKDEVEYNRKPRQMVVSYLQTINGTDVSSSRSVSIANPLIFNEEKMAAEALDVLKKNTETFFKNDNCNVLNNPIKFLGLSVGKFENHDSKNKNTIQDMFRKNLEGQVALAGLDKSTADEDPSKTELNSRVPNECTNDPAHGKCSMQKISKAENGSDAKKATSSFFANFRKSPMSPSTENISALKTNSPNPESLVTDTECFSDQLDLNSVTNKTTSREEIHRVAVEPCESPISAMHSASTTRTTPDYTHTYAEFHRPSNLRELEIPTMACTQCQKPVKITEMQTHTDAHLAYQLSQDQRKEFRNQLKTVTKPAIKSPPSKKSKIVAKSLAPPGISSLDRFLIRKDVSSETEVSVHHADGSSCLNESTTPANAPDCTEICSECNKPIPISCIVEHMDYHIAKKLQVELQKEAQSADHAARNNNDKLNVKKGQSNNQKKRKKSIDGFCKPHDSVASFFTK